MLKMLECQRSITKGLQSRVISKFHVHSVALVILVKPTDTLPPASATSFTQTSIYRKC